MRLMIIYQKLNRIQSAPVLVEIITMETKDDAKYMKLAIEQARQCLSPDKDPFVGAVAVLKDGNVVTAHRGENNPGEHAEFTLLEIKLKNDALAGSTIYTTLEPCTFRGVGKVPCANRLIERRVSRVVIGMLDPDQRITGQGILMLRNAGIAVDLYPPDLTAELEELNRNFTRTRLEQSMIEKIPPAGFFVWDSILELQFSRLLERASEIWVMARSGINMLSRYTRNIKMFLERGGEFNLMITNPDSAYVGGMYNSNINLPKANIDVALSHIEFLRKEFISGINVKLLNSPPSIGVLIVRGSNLVYDVDSVIQVMLYPKFSSTGSGRPMICILPSMEPWYTILEQDVLESWKIAEPIL